jgi:hypothetical protein
MRVRERPHAFIFSFFSRSDTMIRRRLATSFSVIAIGLLLVGRLFAAVPAEFQLNYDDGWDNGYTIGYDSGFISGKDRGNTEGTSNGKSQGYDAGWNEVYQPAYDRAYAANLLFGHLAGWNEGVLAGFEEGLHRAPAVAQILFNNPTWGNSGVVASIVFDGTLSVNLGGAGGFGGADFTVWRQDPNYDWASHYYDAGYSAGHSEGFTIGSDAGYDLTYSDAFDAAYPIGYNNGTIEGTQQGRRNGREAGLSEGWDLGFRAGFDEGLYAGIDYGIFGEFEVPSYGFPYGRLVVPEPGGLALMCMAVVWAAVRRKSRK